MTIKKILLLHFFIVIQLLVLAQNTEDKQVYLIARAQQDSISLRWAPSNFFNWDAGNTYGYILERTTILRDSNFVTLRIPWKLTKNPIKPLPMMEWEPFVHQTKYAAITCQAIYGETFKTDMGSFDPGTIKNKLSEQKQRYSIALLSADYSPLTAKISGLLHIDNTTKRNESYLYKLWINFPDSLGITPDTAMVYISNNDFKPLPVPRQFHVLFGDKIVTMSWDSYTLRSVYTAYEIEKSVDGKNYSSISESPIIELGASAKTAADLMYYLDSLEKNNTKYYFRLRGISSFGEKGPYTKVISGEGKPSPKAVPRINKHIVINDRVLLEWEYPEEEEHTIDNFVILRSDNDKNGFQPIATNIKTKERSFWDKQPLPTAYYKIGIQKDGVTIKTSFSVLEQLIDSIPPDKPKELKGSISNEGIVTISWKANTEKDIFGYRIFRSTSGVGEFAQLTHKPVKINAYTDTLNKKDLNEFVYYTLMAVDHRQNQSELSEVLKLEKPDWHAPSPPVFTETKASTEGVKLSWIQSGSKDVEKYYLLRKHIDTLKWDKIATIEHKPGELSNSFIDINAGQDTIWHYRLIAVDDALNNSEPGESIQVKAFKSRLTKPVEILSHVYNPENATNTVEWETPDKDVAFYIIYRKIDEGSYIKHRTISGDSLNFTDRNLKTGETVSYRIQAKFKDGSISGFSNEYIVKL